MKIIRMVHSRFFYTCISNYNFQCILFLYHVSHEVFFSKNETESHNTRIIPKNRIFFLNYRCTLYAGIYGILTAAFNKKKAK